MLTQLTIRKFKRFENVQIELGNPVVFIGPNNSGKTTALQALALWNIGMLRWSEKRKPGDTPEKRPGVTINRRDLIAIPVPETKLLWRNLHIQQAGASPRIMIDIIVEGVSASEQWVCGLEFYYANSESLYCRPLRSDSDADSGKLVVPQGALAVRVAFLPPMSGLAEREFAKQRGEIDFLIGQGRTAEVLRNLFWQILQQPGGDQSWDDIAKRTHQLFGIELLRPEYIPERSELVMQYRDRGGHLLDLSSAGRGLHQTLLLLAYIAANPGTVLLLDEPDAHLEILRQRQTYQILSDMAALHQSQVVIASHSEVILNEAADRDVVVAFVGQPHRIDDRGAQVAKALKSVGFENYYLAETKGWVLFLEGSTDLAILQAFAQLLEHPAQSVFDALPFVDYIQNQPMEAVNRFHALREAKPDLTGYALCDRLDRPLPESPNLPIRTWARREIENYLCQPETLLRFAECLGSEGEIGPLFVPDRRSARDVMEECIHRRLGADVLADPDDSFWFEIKASEAVLDPIFSKFYERLGLPNLMTKTDYHRLVPHVSVEAIDPEVAQVLDDIVRVAEAARPAFDPDL